MNPTLDEIETVADPERAACLLKPLRAKILEHASSPRSATEIAARLGLPRQKVNYHVRELARLGFLRDAGEVRKRNLIEKRFVASARAYTISPEILGPVQSSEATIQDRFSAAYLLALGDRLQRELGQARKEAARRGQRIATLALDASIRFESPEQRRAFTDELRKAIAGVVARHTSPWTRPDGSPGEGRPFRLVIGCYPPPPDALENPVTPSPEEGPETGETP